MELPARQTLSRDERLKLGAEFRRCIKQGGRAVGKYIVVHVAGNELGLTRLGAGSTKRLGNAVARNRAKRIVREAFRLVRRELPEDVDMVVLPKVPWQGPTVEELKADLVETARRAADALGKDEPGRGPKHGKDGP